MLPPAPNPNPLLSVWSSLTPQCSSVLGSPVPMLMGTPFLIFFFWISCLPLSQYFSLVLAEHTFQQIPGKGCTCLGFCPPTFALGCGMCIGSQNRHDFPGEFHGHCPTSHAVRESLVPFSFLILWRQPIHFTQSGHLGGSVI